VKQYKKSKGQKRTFVLIVVMLLAIVTVAVSMLVIMRTNMGETITTESSSSVTITQAGVNPSTITVKKGGTVTWVNQDDAPHALEITSPNPPRELEGFGTQEPITNGESYSYTFESVGHFTYDDPQNPERVKGTVVVE